MFFRMTACYTPFLPLPSNIMSKKRSGGMVYSTNTEYLNNITIPTDQPDTLLPEKQRLKVRMERKGRGGKVVTLISGFVGNNEDLVDLGKRLKVACGVGGSSKDGEIILQGDFVQKVKSMLQDWGYKV